MRIGVDGRALQDRPWSGVGQYTNNLLHALFGIDHENEYYVFYNAYGELHVPTFEAFENVKVRRSKWPNKFFNLSLKLLRRPFIDGGCDVFFMPNLNFVALPSQAKLVTVVHDLSFVHFPEHFARKSRLVHTLMNPHALLRRADHIIAVSKHTKGDLIETYGIAPEKVTVVYPGIHGCHPERPPAQAGSEGSLTNVSTHAREIPRYARNDGGGSYILYFGALEPRKNIESAIDAFELLDDPQLTLVIAGLRGPYTGRIKKKIAQSPLRTRIQVKENPSEEEKHALYAGARLFVYPSFYEGFGFPPLEAMARGVPVVASSAAAVPEVCGDAALLVSPWNVSEIKMGMQILLENKVLRETYKRAGMARVHDYSWKKCAHALVEIFSKVGYH